MKKLEKMSLANMEGKLTRKEMKNIIAGSGGWGISSGYFYDGRDCWIYGTWHYGNSGNDLFVPASALSQVTHNVCGWSNVG